MKIKPVLNPHYAVSEILDSKVCNTATAGKKNQKLLKWSSTVVVVVVCGHYVCIFNRL